MRNLLAKAGILAGLMLVFGIAGHAQISQQYRAEVPFDFSIKGKAYAAGSYSVGPVSPNSNAGTIAILDRKTGRMLMFAQTQLAENPRVETGKLVFVKTNNGWVLSQISTRTFAIKMKAPTADYRLAQKSADKTETVAVDLR